MKQQFKKKALVLAITGLIASGAFAQTNLGFEDGTTAGWTSSTLSAVGSTTTAAGPNTWVINPYGSYMGQLQIQNGSYTDMATSLGLTSASSSSITTLLQQQAATGGGNPNPTTAGWVTREVTLTAGTTFTLAWQYVSVDYVPFNDGSIATLTQSGTSTATVNNYNQQYALLGFTNPGTGDYSTGSYGATGWQIATFQVSVDGIYTLGFGVFNLGDTALSPVLYIDEVQGTTTLNGQTFGAVAPNNDTAPSSPEVTPPPPTTPTTISTVDSGTTAGTDNLASAVTVNGGTIQISSNNITLTNTFTTDANGMTVDQNGNTVDFSGVISGAGGVTIANTSTGGGVTFSAVNTYTGTTTVNTGAGLNNTGTIAGDVNNQGIFLNDGTVGNLVNGADGTNTSAVAINNGTLGTVDNYGLFTNSGTTSDVTNFGTISNTGTTGDVNNFSTFNNTGIVGTFDNAGVLNNTVGGVVDELGYNNNWVQNSGTINTITYNGGTVVNNSNGTIGTITTTEAHGTFHNEGTVTGDVSTNGTFNNYTGGTVQGNYTNDGTLNNAGTLNTVTNNATFNNQEGGVVSGLTTNSGTLTNDGTLSGVANTGTFTNNSVAGDVNNSSTFNNTGTAGDVVNTGIFTNTGTAGDVTLVSGTFSNIGTVASVDNTAGLTVTNNGIVTGAVTNTGTFTNEGNVGSALNSNTFINNNTVGNVTNTGTFTNNATVGEVTNSGTVNNTGTTGTVTNTGWFTNALNAITGFVTNSNIFTNAGTTGAVTNTGTFDNQGTAGNVDNAGTFANTGTTGDVSNAGTFSNAGTTGNVTNTGMFDNQGTAGQVLNEGTFNNQGTASDVVNAGTFNNSGSTGPVTNQGTFNLTGNGTVSSIVNNGTIQAPAVFNATDANSNVTVAGYSQNAFGSTMINGNQKIIVSGDATLGGDLHINNVPNAYGRYQYLTSTNVEGQYDTLTLNPDIYPLGYELVYTGADVKLKVTPSAIHTQSSIDGVTNSLSSVTNLQMASLGGSLGYDCNVYGENNICMSVGARVTAEGSNNLSAASLVLGYRVSPNWRVGVFGNQPTNSITVGNVKMTNSQPLLGGFINWNNNADGTGLGVQTSLAMNTADLSIQRTGTQYSEAGKGTTSSNGQAFQIKATYNQPLTDSTSITPYAGLRYTQLTTNGYTETGAVYPLTYNNINQNATDAIAGVTLGHNFTDRLAGFVSAGVVQNLSYSAGTVSGTSEIVNMSKFNSTLPGSGYTSPTVGFGTSYALSKNEYLGLSVGWQERSMLNVNVKSGTITYTVGF